MLKIISVSAMTGESLSVGSKLNDPKSEFKLGFQPLGSIK